MSFGTPIALNTLLLVGGVLAGLTVVAYILKMRRRRFEVPFSTLWQRVLEEKESSSLWRHLKRILSLLLQLLIIGLLLLAVLEPSLGSADRDAKSVVIIIDSSASMKTLDEDHESKTPTEETGPKPGEEDSANADALDVSRVSGPMLEQKEAWRIDAMLGKLVQNDAYTVDQRRKVEKLAKQLGDPRMSAAARIIVRAELDFGHDKAAALIDTITRPVVNKTKAKLTFDPSSRGIARIEIAKQRAREILSNMGGSDSAMIMRMDGQSTPLSRFTSDMAMLKKTVNDIKASDTPADLRRALAAASDALRGRITQNPMIIIIGDGGYDEEVLKSVVWQPSAPPAAGKPALDELSAIDLSKIAVHYVPVGQRDDNVGIVAFNVRRYLHNKLSYEAYVEVQNFGSEPAKRRLRIYAGDTAIESDVDVIELAPGERLRKIYKNLGGGEDHRLRAVLLPVVDEAVRKARQRKGKKEITRDIFPLDDEAHALLPARTKQTILLVTKDNLYLEGAMLVYENIVVDKLTPKDYEVAYKAGKLDDYSAVVFEGYTPEHLPPSSAHLLYFNPQGKYSPFKIRRTLKGPRITSVNDTHPVMRWLTLHHVNFDKVSVFDVDPARGEVVLARSIRAPMMAAKKQGKRKIAAFGFALSGTDLMLRVAFPLLLVNTLDWFTGDDADLITTYSTGRRFRVPMDGTYGVTQVQVTTPGGRITRAPMIDGQANFYGNSIGIHTLTATQGGQQVATIELAANLANPEESNVAPIAALTMNGTKLTAPPSFSFTRRQSIWLYLALLVLALLCIEWITYNRRLTL